MIKRKNASSFISTCVFDNLSKGFKQKFNDLFKIKILNLSPWVSVIEWDNLRIPRSKELHLLCCQTFPAYKKTVSTTSTRGFVTPVKNKRRARTLEILYLNTLALLCINHLITFSHPRRFNIFVLKRSLFIDYLLEHMFQIPIPINLCCQEGVRQKECVESWNSLLKHLCTIELSHSITDTCWRRTQYIYSKKGN